VLEGDLTDFTLPDVLRLLAATGKTGRLTVDDGTRRGRLELRAGHVRDVSADLARLPLARRLLGAGLVPAEALREALAACGSLPTDLVLARLLVDAGVVQHGTVAPLLAEQTTDAAFDLFRWSTGAFRFVGIDASGADDDLEPALGVEALLEEVSARLDAWQQLVDETGDLDAVVALARPGREDEPRPEVSLSGAAWELLTLVDGRRTLGELIDLAGQGEFSTRSTLTELRHQGIVLVGAPGEPGPVAQRVADHAVVVELERAAGALPAADAAPQAAVADRRAAPRPSVAPPSTPSEAPASVSEPEAAAVPAVPPPSTEAVQLPPPVADPAVATPQLPRATPAATTRPAPSFPEPVLAGQVRQLRTTVRGERLHADLDLDETLVTRLIEGVEAL
jgi:hypothetical protein